MYKNQFVICDQKQLDQYQSINLTETRYLYYHNLDNLEIIKTTNDETLILIGFCLQSDPKGEQVTTALSKATSENITHIISSFTGNFIIILREKIYHDYGNLYGLYLYQDQDEIKISS